MQVPVGTVVHLVSGSVPSLEQPPVTPDQTTWERSKVPEGAGATINEESSEISAEWLDNLFLDNAKARLLAKNSQSMTDSTAGTDERDEHCDKTGAPDSSIGGVGKAPVAEAPLSPANDEHLVINHSRVGEEDFSDDQLLHCSREGHTVLFSTSPFNFLQSLSAITCFVEF